MMLVRAIAPGFYVKMRIPGTADDTFEVPDGMQASWWEPVEGKAGAVAHQLPPIQTPQVSGTKASASSGGTKNKNVKPDDDLVTP